MGRKFSKTLGLFLFLVIAAGFVGVGVVGAAKFSKGDVIRVIDFAGVKVRSTPAGSYVTAKPYGALGIVLDGPQSASLGGITYIWWKIRWSDDGVEGWSAEGDSEDYYLEKISIAPSTRFSIGDNVKVNTASLSVRTDPPELVYDGSVSYGTEGTIIDGPFYGVPKGKPGFWHFWKVDYGSIIGWSVEDYLEKITIQLPSVKNVKATDVTASAATLNAEITDNGGANIDERRFSWGKTSTCSDGWTKDVIVSGNSFSYYLTGLESDTTYYFQAWAHNSLGWGKSSNVIETSFTTIYQNQPPTLSNGYVTPSSGDTSTTFNYYVTYTDSDGDAPTTKYVYIDGSAHTMTKISGSYSSGAIFKYSITLSTGSHNYYFYFNDGHGHTKRLPSSGTYSGPSVSQTIPTPVITGIDPPQPTVSPTRQWISILGNGFVSDSSVTLYIDSSTYPIPSDRTNFVNSTQIKVYVGLTEPGTWGAQVTNPGNRLSNIFSFTVKPAQQTGSIIVSTNLDQATFTITGPQTYGGSGKSWSVSDAPTGTYTITYGDISGYITPSSETKTLSASGSITFSGTYNPSGSEDLGLKAADLAEQVLGTDYLWGGKGWEWNPATGSWVGGEFVDVSSIKNGYYYWNPTSGIVEQDEGVDCSGLVYWTYNKAWEILTGQQLDYWPAYTDPNDAPNPIYYVGAGEQWNDAQRFEQISTTIPTVSNLKPGYLLFLKSPYSHVGMYVGNGYVVHSKGSAGIEKKTLDDWLNIPLSGGETYRDYFLGYGRVKASQTPITDQQKQQKILNMVNIHRNSLPPELVLAISRQEGGEGAFHIDGWNYNSFYRESDAPWAQPTNGDGIMQVTSASGYHEKSGPYTHDQTGYDHAINDGCDYLLENYNVYDSFVQTTLHYNTGPNSLYIYLGRDWGDRNYLSHVATHLSNFIPNIYGIQNQDLVNKLNQGQDILNDYLYNQGIATGQSVSYYESYQVQLDNDLHNIGIEEPLPTITSSLEILQLSPYYVGDTITAQFTIKNKGTASIIFDVLTAGGRDPDNQVADFTFREDIILNPDESYNYEGSFDLTKVGNYHFFCAYKTPDGSWNTAIPTESGVTNVLDIEVCAVPECTSGYCCDIIQGKFKPSGSQPTGYVDDTDGLCSGSSDSETTCSNTATTTCYILTKNYYCNGEDTDAHVSYSLQDTCGTCEYCSDNSLTCDNYPKGTSCGANMECDGEGNCKVIPEGDVDGNGAVDIFDLAAVGLAYGSKPGDNNWNPNADLTGDGKVDIFDLATVGLNYGRTY